MFASSQRICRKFGNSPIQLVLKRFPPFAYLSVLLQCRVSRVLVKQRLAWSVVARTLDASQMRDLEQEFHKVMVGKGGGKRLGRGRECCTHVCVRPYLRVWCVFNFPSKKLKILSFFAALSLFVVFYSLFLLVSCDALICQPAMDRPLCLLSYFRFPQLWEVYFYLVVLQFLSPNNFSLAEFVCPPPPPRVFIDTTTATTTSTRSIFFLAVTILAFPFLRPLPLIVIHRLFPLVKAALSYNLGCFLCYIRLLWCASWFMRVAPIPVHSDRLRPILGHRVQRIKMNTFFLIF